MRVRHVRDSRLGTVMGSGDKKRIRLDDDLLGERTISYLEQDWVPIVEVRPLSPGHIAEILHAGDQMLCRRAGLKMGKPWQELDPEQKRMWIEKGPESPKVRADFYRLGKKALLQLLSEGA